MRFHGGRHSAHLFLICFGDHVAGHVAYALVDDLCHGGHDALCLCAVEALSLEPLDKVVCIKVELVASLARCYRASIPWQI